MQDRLLRHVSGRMGAQNALASMNAASDPSYAWRLQQANAYTNAMLAAHGQMQAARFIHGAKIVRPEWAVQIQNAAPGEIIPIPAPEPFLTTPRAILLTALMAAAPLLAGMVFGSIPLIAAGVAGLVYAAVWVIRKSGLFGVADTARAEMAAYRASKHRPPKRCAVIAARGFGGYSLNP